MRLVIVTGLPATGKSTLARQLATDLGLPLLDKDTIKEALMAVNPPVDAVHSRLLSDLAFERLFAGLQELMKTGSNGIVEGNFRAGSHEAHFRAIPAMQAAQILCRTDEPLRRQRIAARRHDQKRHPGHGDGQAVRDPGNDSLLDLPGPRWTVDPVADAGLLPHLSRQLAMWIRTGGAT